MDAYVAFRVDHGRDPSQVSADPDEKTLGQWLSHQRRLARKGTMPDQRRQNMDQANPHWLSPGRDAEQAWEARAQEYRKFVAEHGHDPKSRATEDGEAGQKQAALGLWLSRQRAAARAGILAPNRRSALTRVNPLWLDSRRASDPTLEWLRNLLAIGPSLDIEAMADSPGNMIADVPTVTGLTNTWTRRLLEVVTFQRRTRHLPGTVWPTNNVVEIGLVSWLGAQEQGHPFNDAWTQHRQNVLDHYLPGWRELPEWEQPRSSRQEHLYQGSNEDMLDQYEGYANSDEQNDRPSLNSDDPAEVALAAWLDEDGDITPEQSALLNELDAIWGEKEED